MPPAAVPTGPRAEPRTPPSIPPRIVPAPDAIARPKSPPSMYSVIPLINPPTAGSAFAPSLAADPRDFNAPLATVVAFAGTLAAFAFAFGFGFLSPLLDAISTISLIVSNMPIPPPLSELLDSLFIFSNSFFVSFLNSSNLEIKSPSIPRVLLCCSVKSTRRVSNTLTAADTRFIDKTLILRIFLVSAISLSVFLDSLLILRIIGSNCLSAPPVAPLLFS